MKLNIFAVIAALIISAACTREDSEISMKSQKADVKINLSTKDLSTKAATKADATTTSTEYKRGDAPEFISGVEFTIVNNEYGDLDDVVKEQTQSFTFSEDASAGEDIVLKALGVGESKITVKSIAKNFAFPSAYILDVPAIVTIPEADRNTQANLNKCAEEVRESFNNSKTGPYFEFEATSDLNVKHETTPQELTMNMTTKNHRLIVAVDNPSDSKYKLKISISPSTDASAYETARFVTPGKSFYYLLNTKTQTGVKTYTLTVKKYTKGTELYMEGEDLTATMDLKEGSSLSQYFIFKDNELVKSDLNVTSITWQDLDKVNQGSELK